MSQPKDPLLEAFESQQEAVKADPTDFNKWVSLLSASEKLVCAPFPLQGSLSSELLNFYILSILFVGLGCISWRLLY